MIEYQSIPSASKAPRGPMIAQTKYDGSSFRCKYTPKNGFCLFGTRTQLIDESTPFWGQMVSLFNNTTRELLERKFRDSKEYRNYREIIIFNEFHGPNSFAGNHQPGDNFEITLFDVLLGHKDRKYVLPQTFIKEFDFVKIPDIVYEGNLTDEFIKSVRESLTLNEGVICKGKERSGAYRGGVWMCKIKTYNYFERLKSKFGEKWADYAE